MPTFSIHIVNKTFASSNEIEASSFEVAQSEALKAALAIGVEEVCAGIPFFGAEIRIHDGSESPQRMMVAIGASAIQ